MQRVQRYDWLDALVDAQKAGVITNGALLLAVKLSKAINWKPKDSRPAGLYWKNDDALADVGAARASFYRHKPSLVETGFLVEVKGNLLPAVPDQSLVETLGALQAHLASLEVPEQSLGETDQSLGETKESQVETQESLGDNPFSVDTFSEDSLSDDSCSEQPPTAGSASEPSLKEEEVEVAWSKIMGVSDLSLTTHEIHPVNDFIEDWGFGVDSGEDPQSQVETEEEKDELDLEWDEYERLSKQYDWFNQEEFDARKPVAREAYENGAYVLKAIGIAFGQVD